MTTSNVDVGGILSALSARGVEKQLRRLPGIEKVDVNYVSGSATVTYDERVVGLREISAKVRTCGYHCSGEQLPKHMCAAAPDR
ncbi:cation transporter [Rhodococcus antarcticus]|jgi:Cu2+-exporting ATPase|uniref:Cation transporter n=1 Tax=Rhodococcus antarcticus TaxID=2987751 RepID=A0ABY6P2X2_9NOCA|nr:heavy-metal-associated domain-containing protein [Rhodococcus antarcticus]UZJ25997.1 cation transporter [Rhodococcus antarcticus]